MTMTFDALRDEMIRRPRDQRAEAIELTPDELMHLRREGSKDGSEVAYGPDGETLFGLQIKLVDNPAATRFVPAVRPGLTFDQAQRVHQQREEQLRSDGTERADNDEWRRPDDPAS